MATNDLKLLQRQADESWKEVTIPAAAGELLRFNVATGTIESFAAPWLSLDAPNPLSLPVNLFFDGTKIVDGAEVGSIDPGYRQLLDLYGAPSTDWHNRQLIADDGETVMADWSESAGYFMVKGIATLTDGSWGMAWFDPAWEMLNIAAIRDGASQVISIAPNDRQLIASDGVGVMADWSDSAWGLKFPQGINTNTIYDDQETPLTAISVSDRQLISKHNTIAAVWNSEAEGLENVFWVEKLGGLNGGGTSPEVNILADNIHIFDGMNTEQCRIALGVLQHADGTPSLNWLTHQLIAEDGTTVIAYWGDDGATGKLLDGSGNAFVTGTPWQDEGYLTSTSLNLNLLSIQDDGNGGCWLAPTDGSKVLLLGAGVDKVAIPGAVLSSDYLPSVNIESRRLIALGGTTTQLDWSNGILMPNLPTADPEVAGQLWNDSGTVKISAG